VTRASDRDPVVAGALATLTKAGGALLIDLELTCWEDSLRTDWADPSRPAEVIEVGLAVYRLPARRVAASFSRLVRPVRNPRMSAYCVDLLHIPQAEIDAAHDLTAVVSEIGAWLADQDVPRMPTCGWASNDRRRLAENAAALGVGDPLEGRRHIDLCEVMTALHGASDPLDRDVVRSRAHLPPNPRRHRALDDALDLTHFLALLPGAAG
jgi:inhibitor of KinA sporulation pathway (predicted exonuclease)